RTRRRRNIDAGKVIKVFQPLLRALDHHLVEGVALAEVEFAADDVVARTRIAPYLDALDIGLGALVDRVDNGNGAILEIAVAARRHLRKSVARTGHLFGERDDRILD